MLYDSNGYSLPVTHGCEYDIKVMTYNVGGWYWGSGDNVPADKDAEYFSLHYNMIKNNLPDILLLEEYWKIFSKTGRTAISFLSEFFPYIHEEESETNPLYAGRCVCSKYPIESYTAHEYVQGDGNYYDDCVINISGKNVAVIPTHLNVRTEEIRRNELQELITHMNGLGTCIAGGDFNTAVWVPSTQSTNYIEMIKPWIDAGYNSANCDKFGYIITSTAYPDNNYRACLDNIITSSDIDIKMAVCDNVKETDDLPERVDHMPFIAYLKLH